MKFEYTNCQGERTVDGIFYDFLGKMKIVILSLILANIATCAFANENVETLIINDLQAIEDEKYKDREDFENVIFADSVKNIGNSSFMYCSGLKNLLITSGIESIGEFAFCRCRKLKSVQIDYGVKEIKRGVFSECDELEYVKLPESLTNIGAHAFSCCSKMSNSIVIPSSVRTIDDSAFYGCGFRTIQIKRGLQDIGESAFSKSNLEYIVIPKTVLRIGNGAFYGCAELKAVTVENGLKTIEPYAFSGCKSLVNIVVPDTLEAIGSEAFSGCNQMVSIVITSSVKSIGKDVFMGCDNLSTIIIKGCYSDKDSNRMLELLKKSGIPEKTKVVFKDLNILVKIWKKFFG